MRLFLCLFFLFLTPSIRKTKARMILYPNAKINIGLNILNKREDGFHNIETLFYPILLTDILEINHSESFQFTSSGIAIDCDPEKNLVVKAFRIMQHEFDLTNVSIHLHKIIPFGAGLGGGSSDAAFTIRGLNDLFKLNLEIEQMAEFARKLGSDCAFFIYNTPLLGRGKGDELEELPFELKPFYLVLVKPAVMVSTAQAYANVKPFIPSLSLIDALQYSTETWHENVINRFEESVFSFYPEIASVKEKLYQLGAVYASMSGSGSAVFGLFDADPGDLSNEFSSCYCWKEKCQYGEQLVDSTFTID